MDTKMDKILAPYVASRGALTLERTMDLYHVPQNLWRINVERYFKERADSLSS